jgi:hypothetical protein
LQIKGVQTAGTVKFKDCQFLAPISATEGSILTMTDCELSGLKGLTQSVLSLFGSTLTWTGGKISDNSMTGDSYPIHNDVSSTLNLKGTLSVTANGNPQFVSKQIRNQGKLVIDGTVSITCSTIFNDDGGTGSCKGSPL